MRDQSRGESCHNCDMEMSPCNKQLHLAPLHVSMWPPTTSRILEPPNCLPANWEALWADKMQHKVIMFVLAQSESLKISQNWANREHKNYFGGLKGKGAPAPRSRFPFSFLHQWEAGIFVSLPVPLKKRQNPILVVHFQLYQLYGHAQVPSEVTQWSYCNTCGIGQFFVQV